MRVQAGQGGAIRRLAKRANGSRALMMAGILAIPGVSAAEGGGSDGKSATGKSGKATSISAGELAKNSADYIGTTVRISAEVNDILGPTAFTLDEDRLFAGPDVLVVVPKGQVARFGDGKKVTVTGKVRAFSKVEIEREFDLLGRPELEAEFSSRPVLIAESVKGSGGKELLMSTEEAKRSVQTVSAGDIARQPGRYYGGTVQVRAEIEDIRGPHAFTLDEDALFAGPDVLVIVPRPVADARPKDDAIVTVTGTVRPMIDAELKRDWDLTLDNDLLVRYSQRPVLIATSVKTQDGVELVDKEKGRSDRQPVRGTEDAQPGQAPGADDQPREPEQPLKKPNE